VKKLFAALVLLFGFCLFPSPCLFAQDNAQDKMLTFGVDMVRDAYFIRDFTGSYASADMAEKIATGDIYPYQGGPEKRVFNASAFDAGLEIWLGFRFSSDHFGVYGKLMSNFASLWVSDFDAWLKLGPWFGDALSLRLVAGNQEQIGGIPHYNNLDDFLKFKKDGLGVVVPINTRTKTLISGNNNQETEFPYGYGQFGVKTGYADYTQSNISNLFSPAGKDTEPSGFLIELGAGPVNVAASVGNLYESLARPFVSPWESVWDKIAQNLYQNNRPDDLVGDSTVNMGFRVESARIAGLVTVSALYKYAELSKIKLEASVRKDILDAKRQNHEYGLYFNIEPLPTLGITAGYSGLYELWTNSKPNPQIKDVSQWERDIFWLAEYRKAEVPLYHGIDLRFFFSIAKLGSITFNNNITFAKVQGYDIPADGPDQLFRTGWTYQEFLRGDSAFTEQFLGVNNVLGVKYEATETLTVDLQVANQLGIFTLTWPGNSASTIANCLGLYAGADFRFLEIKGVRASVRGGFALALHSNTYQSPRDMKKFSAGYYDIAIPLGIKVEY